jgi:hypothetical protein
MSQAQIGAALKARIDSLSFTPAIPLAWPNKDFKPDGPRFIQVQILPAPNQRLTLNGRHRRYGSLILTVASRVANGSGEGDGLADAVAAHFPCDLTLDAGGHVLRITDAPSVREGFLEGGFWRTPVVIPYETRF